MKIAYLFLGMGLWLAPEYNLEKPATLGLDDLKYYELYVESMRQHRCISIAVFMEARGEPNLGKKAVAKVILNRSADGRWDSDPCEVVYQQMPGTKTCQFSWACIRDDEYIENLIARYPRAWQQSQDVAWDALLGELPNFGGITHFHNTSVDPWSSSDTMIKKAEIGNHIFYREKI